MADQLETVKLVLQVFSPGAVAALGWWLKGKFQDADNNARTAAETVAKQAKDAIDNHEVIDQGRHKENVASIKEISKNVQDIAVRLARAGINGNH
jgi:hypothetical protein